MENGEWKSPRKLEEERKEYELKRFEDYMQMVDDGEIPTRQLAIAALREEIAYREQFADRLPDVL